MRRLGRRTRSGTSGIGAPPWASEVYLSSRPRSRRKTQPDCEFCEHAMTDHSANGPMPKIEHEIFRCSDCDQCEKERVAW